jgi:predicted transcriptional regulator
MSIHPRYAEAIVSGRKRAEFRKRSLAADVDLVLIYATAPISAIVGWFTVQETVKTTPEVIWQLLHDVGEICWADFSAYYSGYNEGVALLVGTAERLARPIALSEIKPSPATPQSFSYVPDDIMAQIAGTRPPKRQPAFVCAARGSC